MTYAVHLAALLAYLGAALVAALPLVRPVGAPVRRVAVLLGLGVVAHVAAFALLAVDLARLPLTGLGPSLSIAGLVLAATLLVAELAAREVSLTLIAAPLAGAATAAALVVGLVPGDPTATRGGWLLAHVALSFAGLAAFATAGAAGAMYLAQRRELKERRFGAVLRLFPPLATLDRVNHVAVVAGWITLTLGIVLTGAYSVAFRQLDAFKLTWGVLAWAAVTTLAVGRVVRGWHARRAAVLSAATCGAVLVLYVALRAFVAGQGKFL